MRVFGDHPMMKKFATDRLVVGIAGTGAMGRGIAQVIAQAGCEVLLYDVQEGAAGKARDYVIGMLGKLAEKGRLTAAQQADMAASMRVVDDAAAFAPCDLVVEVIVENLAIKREFFARLEAVTRADCVLATNTSSLPIHAIARGLKHPDRVLALHFFNPPPAMKLVELAPHAGTDPAAITRAQGWTEVAGKTVILCPDRPGFIVNRCARPYYGEALALLAEGRSALEIDAAMTAAGYRLGPFALIDLIGADINLAATEGMYAAMGNHPRYHPFDALKTQVASGNLGRKTGRGFVFPDPPAAPPQDADAIALRIEATLVNEAHWLLAEGGTSPDGIDTAMRLGLNFPRGPFEALARHGPKAIVQELARLRAAAPEALKSRYDPAPMLEAK